MPGGFLRPDGADLILAVRLTPRAARDAVGDVWQDEKGSAWLQASVRAVPEKGKANTALIKLLSARLAIPPSRVIIESGATARLKRLRLVDVKDIDEVSTRLLTA